MGWDSNICGDGDSECNMGDGWGLYGVWRIDLLAGCGSVMSLQDRHVIFCVEWVFVCDGGWLR